MDLKNLLVRGLTKFEKHWFILCVCVSNLALTNFKKSLLILTKLVT